MQRNLNTYGLMTLVAVASAGAALAQTAPPLTLPRPSQSASISQTVGLTEIAVTYSRPGVRGRTIWGGLVPFDQVWRVGANENTTISFSTPVTIGGTAVPAGKYGLHAIPTREEWTMILSSVNGAWGSFGYDPAEDVLRVAVRPEPAPHTEFMSFTFDDPAPGAVTVALRWDKLRVPFTVEVDTPAVVIASMRRELRGLHQFFWQPLDQAAAYCLRQKRELDQAMEWVDKSIAINENFTNVATKAGLLRVNGDETTAQALIDKALPGASETELNAYGYTLLGDGRVKDAIAAFTLNTERHPESWNVWDSLAEAHDRAGETRKATSLYEKALELAPENQKPRIQEILSRLGKR